ncbi:MAG: DUF4091 domain-containing protein [Planctomycetota bacterium]|nr:DUF4091 domain-containing protein [Planctomycetota bacterium]
MDNIIRLSGAANEVVAFNLVLTAEPGDVGGVRIAATDLLAPLGTIPKDRFEIYRYWPVTVAQYPNWYLRSVGRRETRQFLDALVPVDAPLHGQPFALSAGQSMPFWVEIRIPEDAVAGRYEAQITVSNENRIIEQTPIELKVIRATLGRDTALPVPAKVQLGPIISARTDLDPENINVAIADQEVRRAIDRAFAVLHRHGLDPYTDQMHPGFRQEIDGSVVLDWEDYDAFCGPFIDGTAYDDGVPPDAWPLPADLRQPNPARFNGIDSVRYAAILRSYLAECRDHFAERGWMDRAFAYFDVLNRPDPQPADLARVRRLATLCKLVDPKLAFASELIPQSMTPFGWFEHHFEDFTGLIDIWTTPARFGHPPTLEEQRVLGAFTWLRPDRPPYSGSLRVEAPLVHARSLPWQAFLHGHDALLVPEATNWSDNPFDGRLGEGDDSQGEWLLYPGTFFGLDGPIPSVRLKQLQLGLQDYQYLRLLTDHGRAETARLAASSLIKAAGTDAYGDSYQDGLFGRRVDNPDDWHLARTLISDELESALNGTLDSAAGQASTEAGWREFLRNTRRIEVQPESARLSVGGRSNPTGFRVEFGVGVRSELRTPVTGTMSFGLLPLDWRNVSDTEHVGPLEEMAYARTRLVALAARRPRCDLDGHYVQTIIFDGGASGNVESTAVLSVVTAGRTRQPLEIDGNLSDWPPGASNIAGDFRLIEGGLRAAGRRRRAESQTVAYFCHDGETLFIGLLAAKPDSTNRARQSGPRRFGNVVTYEDLMPRGDDLVEILIDPTNSAILSDDLFHIVLKSTGQAIFEHGIEMSPAIGRSVPWLVKPRWKIEVNEKSWSAELAIPVSAFGPNAASFPIWGVNVARLEPTRGEYSDWARAVRHCYDPRTLGNLVWSD